MNSFSTATCKFLHFNSSNVAETDPSNLPRLRCGEETSRGRAGTEVELIFIGMKLDQIYFSDWSRLAVDPKAVLAPLKAQQLCIRLPACRSADCMRYSPVGGQGREREPVCRKHI